MLFMHSLEMIAVRLNTIMVCHVSTQCALSMISDYDIYVSEVIDGNIGLTDQSKVHTTNIDTIQSPVRNCHLKEHKQHFSEGMTAN